MSTEKPPTGLKTRGKRLWKLLHEDLEFDAHEAAILEDACRLLDMSDEFAAAVRVHGAMVKGSRGQLVANPAANEFRQAALSAARLLTMLNLDAAELTAAISARTAAARAAAQKRWRDTHRGEASA
ncbi:P27 family phage terminase small subunit [Agromyces sp. NPDC057865]|uniref:P27 family phage terminase small subunit n=1 Tax=Agromyces sp. NPDC057865 TaxID=3346267 RepID=UPI00366C5E95